MKLINDPIVWVVLFILVIVILIMVPTWKIASSDSTIELLYLMYRH